MEKFQYKYSALVNIFPRTHLATRNFYYSCVIDVVHVL